MLSTDAVAVGTDVATSFKNPAPKKAKAHMLPAAQKINTNNPRSEKVNRSSGGSMGNSGLP